MGANMDDCADQDTPKDVLVSATSARELGTLGAVGTTARLVELGEQPIKLQALTCTYFAGTGAKPVMVAKVTALETVALLKKDTLLRDASTINKLMGAKMDDCAIQDTVKLEGVSSTKTKS